MLDRPPLSLALASLRPPPGGDPRAPVEWAAGEGFRHVTLDASAPGLRPRELDRSARRDLAALLRRLELGLAGIDLWIPTAHYTDPAHADRAAGAITGALDLAADLAGLAGGDAVVSLSLPRENLPATLRDTLISHADSRHATLADHAWPPAESPTHDALGVGLDPALVLLAGDNPAKAAARLGARLAVARLSDASEVARVEPGSREGRLNDLAFVVALQTVKHSRPLVLDTRGLPSPADSARRVLRWWTTG
jgi:sugar phosphate isomerase/epimerase